MLQSQTPSDEKMIFLELDSAITVLRDISEQTSISHRLRDWFDGDVGELASHAPHDALFDAGRAVGFAEGLARGLGLSLDELFKRAGQAERPAIKELVEGTGVSGP